MIRTTLTRNRRLFGPVVTGLLRGAAARRPELRHHVVRDVWTVAKRCRAARDPVLGRPVYHPFGTRMALWSRQDLVARLPPDDFASLPSV